MHIMQHKTYNHLQMLPVFGEGCYECFMPGKKFKLGGG